MQANANHGFCQTACNIGYATMQSIFCVVPIANCYLQLNDSVCAQCAANSTTHYLNGVISLCKVVENCQIVNEHDARVCDQCVQFYYLNTSDADRQCQ